MEKKLRENNKVNDREHVDKLKELTKDIQKCCHYM